MSLLSPETLHIYYAPGTLLALTRTGWRRNLGQTRAYPVVEGDDDAWRDPLSAFGVALRGLQCPRVRVLLSHHFVQFRILPWRDDLAGDAEYLALAQLEFSSAFGSLAEHWSVALSDEPPGQPRVACAMPSGLLAALTTAAADAGTELECVRPYLVAVAPWLAPRAAAASGNWLLLHENGRVSAAVRQAGAWRWLRHVRVGDDWALKLPELLAEEAVLAGLEVAPAQVQVFAPGADLEAQSTLRASGFGWIDAAGVAGFGAGAAPVFAPAWMA